LLGAFVEVLLVESVELLVVFASSYVEPVIPLPRRSLGALLLEAALHPRLMSLGPLYVAVLEDLVLLVVGDSLGTGCHIDPVVVQRATDVGLRVRHVLLDDHGVV